MGDFRDRGEPAPAGEPLRKGDQEPPPDVDPIEKLIRIVGEAQERDAEDERCLWPATTRAAAALAPAPRLLSTSLRMASLLASRRGPLRHFAQAPRFNLAAIVTPSKPSQEIGIT